MKIQNNMANIKVSKQKSQPGMAGIDKDPAKAAGAVDKFIPAQDENSPVCEGYSYSQYDAAAVDRLKAGVVQAYANLRNLVLRLLERQGQIADDLSTLRDTLLLDQEARAETVAAIAPDGPLSAEAVSGNIVEFAKAISAGDKSKLDLLKGAIEKGFTEAASLLGGQLPAISVRTKELVWQKLDCWAQGA